jgi:hypothetical protein
MRLRIYPVTVRNKLTASVDDVFAVPGVIKNNPL